MKKRKIQEKQIKNINKCKFFTFDLETYPSKKNTHEAYLITLYSEKETKVWFKENNNQNIIREFIDYIKQNYKNYKGFAHNAGNFDARLILDDLTPEEFLNKKKTCLFKDGVILAIYLKNIILVDSLKLLPQSLEKLAKQFELEIAKGNLPHDKITNKTYKKYKEQAIIYCLKDSQILYNTLFKFQSLILDNQISSIDPLSCLTLPQFAFQTFRTTKYFPKDWDLYKLTKKEYNFVAEGYYGGRVDVFITYAKALVKPLFYYDVNSLYPFCMLKDMPEGPGVWLEGNDINLENFFGFLEVTVKVPSNLNIPVLPFRHEGCLYFPKGTFTSVQFSEELKHALSLGYEIKEIKRGLSFNRKSGVFDLYIQEFYKLKEQESKTKGPLYFIAKLLLNALYGKFGMKPIESEFHIIEPKELDKYVDYCTVETVIMLKNALLIRVKDTPAVASLKTKDFFYRKETEGPKLNIWNKNERSPVHVSAAIAAYSRIELDKCIRAVGEQNVCYVDTDSIVILETELPSDKISPSALGLWKEEGQYEEFYGFGPKIYRLIPKADSKYPIIDRCAGIPQKEIKQALDQLKTAKTYTSYQVLNFKKSLNTMEIYTNVPYEKTITAFSTKKRKFIPNSVITEPLTFPDDFSDQL